VVPALDTGQRNAPPERRKVERECQTG
jgi:hypothetical protein